MQALQAGAVGYVRLAFTRMDAAPPEPERRGELDPEAQGDPDPLGLGDEERRELAFLRPFSDEDARRLLRRHLSHLQSGSGHLTPKDRAKLALLIEFGVEDD